MTTCYLCDFLLFVPISSLYHGKNDSTYLMLLRTVKEITYMVVNAV